MKTTCMAGHNAVQFWADRCPVCETIERLDKELLRADVRVAELEEQLGAARMDWHGGPA